MKSSTENSPVLHRTYPKLHPMVLDENRSAGLCKLSRASLAARSECDNDMQHGLENQTPFEVIERIESNLSTYEHDAENLFSRATTFRACVKNTATCRAILPNRSFRPQERHCPKDSFGGVSLYMIFTQSLKLVANCLFLSNHLEARMKSLNRRVRRGRREKKLSMRPLFQPFSLRSLHSLRLFFYDWAFTRASTAKTSERKLMRQTHKAVGDECLPSLLSVCMKFFWGCRRATSACGEIRRRRSSRHSTAPQESSLLRGTFSRPLRTCPPYSTPGGRVRASKLLGLVCKRQEKRIYITRLIHSHSLRLYVLA
jgi:hypothetical protein